MHSTSEDALQVRRISRVGWLRSISASAQRVLPRGRSTLAPTSCPESSRRLDLYHYYLLDETTWVSSGMRIQLNRSAVVGKQQKKNRGRGLDPSGFPAVLPMQCSRTGRRRYYSKKDFSTIVPSSVVVSSLLYDTGAQTHTHRSGAKKPRPRDRLPETPTRLIPR